MNMRLNRGGITLIEVLVVLAILMVVVGLLLPATRTAREAGRRTQCINKIHQLGLAMHNYASTNNTFPASSSMSLSGSSSFASAGGVKGWSFLVKLLPYTEYTNIYKNLPLDAGSTGVQGLITTNGSVQIADQTALPDFVCPSNKNNSFVNNSGSPPSGSLTNYKAMSASTEASLAMCVDPTGKPPYGTAKLHPDGAIYPGKDIPLAGFISDGLSHTIMLMETQDDKYSRWIVGAEASLVGLPPSASPTGAAPTASYPYLRSPGYDGTFGDSSAVAQAGLQTFLEYDFSPTGANYGGYAKDKAGDPDWDTTIPNTYMYGPGSPHPAVVIVGFADGNATGLNKRVDAANLFFSITRQNGDPFNLP